jgi:hypothetical protein
MYVCMYVCMYVVVVIIAVIYYKPRQSEDKSRVERACVVRKREVGASKDSASAAASSTVVVIQTLEDEIF